LEGESYVNQRPLKISQGMQKIIDDYSKFDAKPIGPLYKHLSEHFRYTLPSAFLHCYIVASYDDSAAIIQLCQDHHEVPPERLVRSYCTEIYADVLNDTNADTDAINLLQQENPVVANLLIDYFGLHKHRKFIWYCILKLNCFIRSYRHSLVPSR